MRIKCKPNNHYFLITDSSTRGKVNSGFVVFSIPPG